MVRFGRRGCALLLWALFVPGFSLFAAEPEAKPEAKPEIKSDAKEAAKADPKRDEEYYELYRSFADTFDQIERNYVKDISRRELMEAAIQGMLKKLDPYSSYISPDEIGKFKSTVENQFGGIGIQITIDAGQLKILSPLVDTPAYKAGLLAGDKIVKIEGKPTDGLNIDEAVKLLKGEAGTSITLTVSHADNKPETVTLKREVIQVETVLGDRRGEGDRWDFMLDSEKKIAYIRITSFSRDTARDLKRALEQLQKQKLRGLILDLRFNPGGLLTSAIEVSDLFVSEGVIVSTEGRNTPKRVWNAKKEGTFEGFPIAVLVNRYSASASEIVSACLQDHQRAVIIGERTWGKGSVQNVIELEDGKSALKLTTAGYLRPNGHNIHRFPDAKETDEWGVKPDDTYEVKLSETEMGRLMQLRRERDIVTAKKKPEEEKKPAAEEKPAKEPDSKPEALASLKDLKDRQLNKALDYLSSEFAKAPE